MGYSSLSMMNPIFKGSSNSSDVDVQQIHSKCTMCQFNFYFDQQINDEFNRIPEEERVSARLKEENVNVNKRL